MPSIKVPYHLDEPVSGLPAAATTVEPDLAPGPQPPRLVALYREVAAVVTATMAAREPGPPPLAVLSADCTTALGVLAGLQGAGVDPAIVWFDAHGDFNTVETTESGYLGGMALAIAAGRDDLRLGGAIGLAPVDEERIVLVDARDLDAREADLLAGSAVTRATVAGLDASTLPPGPLYLHIDLDVIEPDESPGLRYPAPGGPGIAEVAAAVGRVMAGEVVAVGLACTWTPDGLAAGQAARTLDLMGLSALL